MIRNSGPTTCRPRPPNYDIEDLINIQSMPTYLLNVGTLDAYKKRKICVKQLGVEFLALSCAASACCMYVEFLACLFTVPIYENFTQ